MGTAIKKSSAITSRDSTPPALANSSLAKGALLEAVGQCEALTTEDLGSTYIMCQVPSNARISQILLSSDDLGTAGLMNVGIYQTTANGSAVVDADFFASAIDMFAAGQSNVDITHEADAADAAAGYGRADVEKPLWEALGLTSDPKRDYDIVITSTEAPQANGTIGLKARYVI